MGRGLRATYFRQLAFVVAIVLLSLAVLPRSTGELYAMLLTNPLQMAGQTQVAVPILGEESCRPFKDGLNSIAMRWLHLFSGGNGARLNPLDGERAYMLNARHTGLKIAHQNHCPLKPSIILDAGSGYRACSRALFPASARHFPVVPGADRRGRFRVQPQQCNG